MRHRWLILAASFALLAGNAPRADDAISEAEQRVFTDHHLRNVAPGATLHYDYRESGSEPAPYEGKVSLSVSAAPKGSNQDARAVAVEFLSGEHQLQLPALDAAESNPVILYFLESDVRSMHRALGGQEGYFRKRIRLALADRATVSATRFEFGGKTVSGKTIAITPFVDDAMKARFKHLVDKRYVFTVSDNVPGLVYRIETRSSGPAEAGGKPIETVLTLSPS